jgi:SAM-dependent methyltransferase
MFWHTRETLNDFPKKHCVRNRIAKQIRYARRRDRASFQFPHFNGLIENPDASKLSYTIDRNGAEYEYDLQGLSRTFDYVRELPSNIVLDIGSGITQGIVDLSKRDIGKGLDFEATVLSPMLVRKAGLRGEIPLHATCVESLRGIADQSIGCVLGLFSVHHSNSTKVAMQSINRVLVPGGVLKMRAWRTEELAGILRGRLKYDVAVDHLTVLAIKPGFEGKPVIADDLLRLDSTDLRNSLPLGTHDRFFL